MSCLTTFKKNGMRLTPQRKLIVEILHTVKGFLTAEEIIAYVREKEPGVNKSTVYRNLELLEKAGCVYKSEFAKQTIYHHDEAGHHHHLICSRCGKKIDGDEDFFYPFEEAIAEKYGFQVDFKHLVISGLCEECIKKSTGV